MRGPSTTPTGVKAQIQAFGEAAVERARAAAKQKAEKPVSPNREVLKRRMESGTPEDQVLGVIGMQKSALLETRAGQNPDQLGHEIASLALLDRYQAGETFSPDAPLLVELRGTTYAITEVFADQAGELRFRMQTGVSVSKKDIIKQQLGAVRDNLPPPAPDESRQIAFVRDYVEHRMGKNGSPPSPELIKEAARETGMFVTDDIIAFAETVKGPDGKPLLSETDVQILKGQKPMEADGTMPTKPSERAVAIQAALSDTILPDVAQVRGVFQALEIPTNNVEAVAFMQSKLAQLEAAKQRLAIRKGGSMKPGETPEQIEAEMQALEQLIEQNTRGIAEFEAIQKEVKTLTGSEEWDALSGFASAVEEGAQPCTAPEFMQDLADSSSATVKKYEDRFDEKAAQFKRDESRKALKEKAVKYAKGGGFGLLAINALVLWMATKKLERPEM